MKEVYKVVEKFKDRDGTVYEIGDIYKGDRINALSTRRNSYKTVFIEKVTEEKEGD